MMAVTNLRSELRLHWVVSRFEQSSPALAGQESSLAGQTEEANASKTERQAAVMVVGSAVPLLHCAHESVC